MAQVICNITQKRREIYKGDLVSINGKVGIMCSNSKGVSTEQFYIQGFDGIVLKHYGEDYSAVDEDAEVVLVCNREQLEITLSKRGE